MDQPIKLEIVCKFISCLSKFVISRVLNFVFYHNHIFNIQQYFISSGKTEFDVEAQEASYSDTKHLTPIKFYKKLQ